MEWIAVAYSAPRSPINSSHLYSKVSSCLVEISETFNSNIKMYLPTLSAVISLVFLVRETESRFLEDHQVEEEVVFNLNSDSQQRTEELATFLTVN